MDSYRRQQIEAKAKALLTELGINELPVDPIAVAKALDIQVHAKAADASGSSGWLIRQGNNFAIVYATHVDNLGFQSFSVAHELGHYCLDGHPEHVFRLGNEHISRGAFSSSDPVEREADYFAACLLMPRHLCSSLVAKAKDGMAAVLSLASACNTSLVAAAIRYTEIGHVASGVVQCLNGRVEFCAIHPLQAHVGWARPLPRNSKPPMHSATARLSADPLSVRGAQEDSESLEASEWFSGARSGIYLNEEVIGLGRFGRTLTLLTIEDGCYEEDEEETQERHGLRFR